MTYWILFRSITHAQRAARLLERGGITATATRAPQGLSPKGCAYAVIFRIRLTEALRLLEVNRINHGQVWERLESGEFREVQA